MTNPFVNDPIAILWQAFQNLYPNKPCECYFDVLGKDKQGNNIFGTTYWSDNGEPTLVFVSCELKLTDAVEIFAHELAHVAAGNDAEHGAEWQNAFDALFAEYNRIGDELFDSHQRVEVVNGKECYYKENE